MTVPHITDKVPAGARVVANAHSPGKAGAIATGLDALAGEDVDLIVLTDADVIHRALSLLSFEHAFRTRPELGMACGLQEFVRDLRDDGSCRGAQGHDPVPASEPYDRWTAVVRQRESGRGRLFSVHGQLLAWRASLGLRPTPGIAADDLDLMFQARAQACASSRSPHGLPGGEAARRSGTARAAGAPRPRVCAGHGRPAAPAGRVARRAGAAVLLPHGPAALPWLAGLLLLLLVLASAAAWAAPGAPPTIVVLARWLFPALMALYVLALVGPPGNHARQLLGILREARRLERQGTLPDRWDRVAR